MFIRLKVPTVTFDNLQEISVSDIVASLEPRGDPA